MHDNMVCMSENVHKSVHGGLFEAESGHHERDQHENYKECVINFQQVISHGGLVRVPVMADDEVAKNRYEVD